MASIEQASVRQQLDSIKNTVHVLSQSGKLSSEVTLLFNTLFALFDIVLAVLMEKHTRKTSKNSSIPPSQSDPDASSKPPISPKKKQRTKAINTAQCRTETITVTTLEVEHCAQCHTDLSNTSAHAEERRTLIDIRFEKRVQHLDSQSKVCPKCKTLNKPAFPKPFAGPQQYGPGVQAFIINLLVVQMVALRRAQTLVNGLINQLISEATLLKYVLVLHNALQQWENETSEWLIKQPVIHTDETSLRVDKEKQWIHVYASGPVTLKKLHPKRGKEAVQNINLIPRFHGTIIHDCWASYLSYNHCDHGLCGSHLLRELTFVVDSNGYAWARNMKRLLKHTCRVVSQRKNKKLSKKEHKRLLGIYQSLLEKGLKEMPDIPEKPNKKRGKVAKSDAHNLHERLQKHQNAVLLFAKKSEIPFTNNRAERDLRMSKVKQKVSGCFRKTQFAQAYCRISSYLQTMTAKGFNPITSIEMALSGELYRL